MVKIFLNFVTVFILIISIYGCSSKRYYEPKDTLSYNDKKLNIGSEIKQFNYNGATLKDGSVVIKDKVFNKFLPKGFEFVNIKDNMILAVNKDKKLLIKDINSTTIFNFEKNVVSATLDSNLLALIFVDNSIATYNMDISKIIFKEYFTPNIINDNRIANPIFMKDIILFPTLDGKIAIVGKTENKLLKNITISTTEDFKNIIYFNVVDEYLIAATNKRIISLGTKDLEVQEYNIRDIVINGKDIYIATLEGEVLKLDLNLNMILKKKYKYAKFYTITYLDSIYLLESQGFLIKLDNDFKKDKIYNFDFDDEKRVVSYKDRIYFDDKYIILK